MVIYFIICCINRSSSLFGGESSSAPKENGGSGSDISGDTFTYATTTDAVGLSPTMTNDSPSANVIEQVYETLFQRNSETLEIEPKLAESYEIQMKIHGSLN